MITKYYKGIRNYKYKTVIYSTKEDIKKLIEENNYFHDAEVFAVSVGRNEVNIGFEYEKANYNICLRGIIWDSRTVEFEKGNSFIYELSVEFGDVITTRIDGTSLCIFSKEIAISSSAMIENFPSGVIVEG